MVSQLHISVMAEIELVLSDSAATEWVEVIEELAIPGLQVSKLPFIPFARDLYISICQRWTVWEVCFSSILLCQPVVSKCGSSVINTRSSLSQQSPLSSIKGSYCFIIVKTFLTTETHSQQ